MRLHLRWAVPGLLLAPLFAAAASAKKGRENPLDRMEPVPPDQPIPIVDFFRPVLMIAPELNPAGTHFAALISTGSDRRDLAVFETATNKISRLTGGADHDVYRFEWLSDDRLLFSLAVDKHVAAGLYVVERTQLDHAYAINLYDVVTTIGFPKTEPTRVILWVQHSAEGRGDDGGVRLIDVGKGPPVLPGDAVLDIHSGFKTEVLRHYPDVPLGEALGYLADLNGELVFAATAKAGRRELFRLKGETWESCPVDLDKVQVLGVGATRDELLVLEPRREDHPRSVRTLNVISGEFGGTVFDDDEYDIVDGRFYRHPVDDRLLGVQYNRKGPGTVWIDPTYVGLQAGLEKFFPEQMVQILGSDRAEKHFFVQVFSDVNPPSYHQVDLEKHTARALTSSAPWIDPTRMQPMRLLTYKARDGRPIDGYVTLPAGASKEAPVPLVVLPHGGPWARDTWGWDPEVQFLASRGYAVLQPNYRGSDGTAWRFPEEDLWAFRKMHDDVTDGVQTVLRTGLIDRDRIAIMGGSFGGYLAICGAAFEPELYRCAITIAGVFDWEQVMRNDRRNQYRRGSYDTLRRYLGDPKQDQETFENITPLRAVDRIKIPIFVAHGADDHTASISQSKRLIAELKKHRVPFETRFESEEGHGFQQLQNLIELYGDVERFLATHLSPRPAVTGP